MESLTQLEELKEELKGVKEFAIDLEVWEMFSELELVDVMTLYHTASLIQDLPWDHMPHADLYALP